MTLAQIKADERVASVTRIDGQGFDEEDKYELDLADGWYFRDGGGANRYATVKEMSEDLESVIDEAEARRRMLV